MSSIPKINTQIDPEAQKAYYVHVNGGTWPTQTQTTTTVGGTVDFPYNKPVEVPKISQSPCPSCGYCPHCGRGGHQTYPYPNPWITYTYGTTCDSSPFSR